MERDRPSVNTPDFWQGLYEAGEDGWELGEAAPPLRAWLEAGNAWTRAGAKAPPGPPAPPDAHPGGSAGAISGPPQVMIPGCGRGHDVRLLARHGYRVWGFDFADTAVRQARGRARREGLDVNVEQRDVFTLAADYGGFFDGIWEYTCFCAIDPSRREEYVQVMHAVLRPSGTLLACFYPLRDGTDGPPFPVHPPEIERLLAPRFEIVEAGPPAASVERRRGLERMVVARRR